jgi:thiamine-phosphate diphosphorylase
MPRHPVMHVLDFSERQVIAMRAVLHVISDRQRKPVPLFDVLTQAAEGGADVIQIREKKAPALETYQLCTSLKAKLGQLNCTPQLFVNDRVDVAMAVCADGVHLASRSLPPAAVKAVTKQSSWHGLVGVSVHSVEEAQLAAAAGADYVTFGHVFASESHQGQPPRGLLALERVVCAVDIPVIAIGGIDVHNVGPVLDTGCSGVAVIGAVLHHANPRYATERLKEEMDKARTKPRFAFPLGTVNAIGEFL